MLGGSVRSKNWLLAGVAATALMASTPVHAQLSIEVGGVEQDVPILIMADELDYNRETQVVVASGNVEISQGEQILLADRVSYNQRTRVVVAEGNVSILQPDGNVIFADRVELTDDLRDGVVEQFGMLFPDRTRVAASRAVRTDGRRTVMGPTVFSPCYLCEDDPTRAPLWQLRAHRVEHDEATRDITYRHARMEIYGVPVFYTPYLRHPDPTVRRRSGFLPPTFGSDSRLGFTYMQPYFWALGPDRDVTIAPLATTSERAAMFGEYRRRFRDGQFIASGSFTYVQRRRNSTGGLIGGNEVRGHFFTSGRFDINSHWRWGFDGEYASDDTYLRRYDVSSVDTLITSPYVEGFYGRDYYHVRGYYFQSLRQGEDDGLSPIVYPLAEMDLYGEPFRNMGRWNFYASILNLSRTEGTDSRRLSMSLSWRLPYTHRMGWQLIVDASVNGDFYFINDQRQIGGRSFNGAAGRLYPHARILWKYPFVRELGNVRHIVEPQVALVAAPAGLNSSDIPNEDSADLEFDDSNLFSLNRFPGRDRIDDGTRIVYGINNIFLSNSGGRSEIFVGQSYRLFGGNEFGPGSGLETESSDIVGRVRIQPSSRLNLLYRFRLDPNDGEMRRNEVTLSAGAPVLRVTVGYSYFDENSFNNEFPEREEIVVGASSQITENWLVFGSGRWDMSRDGGILSFAFGGHYRNECCEVRLVLNRSFTRDRDLSANTSFTVQVVFKHLGQLGNS